MTDQSDRSTNPTDRSTNPTDRSTDLPAHHIGISGERTRPTATLVSAVASQVAAMFPAFGIGALALQMGDDLGFGEAGLGSAVAFFFLLAAVTSPHAGTLTDQLGPQRSLWIANVLSGLSLLAIATVVRSYWLLLAALAVGAIGLTIAGPGTKTMVASGIVVRRHGLAFGVQAASVPLAAMLAGLAVPAIGLTLGWRWAFAAASVLALIGFVLAPSYQPLPSRTMRTGGATRGLSQINYGPLNMIALAAALGSAAATTMAAFFVSAATEVGLSEGLAGNLLAVASGLPIVNRIVAGYLADRFESGHLRVVSLLLGASTLGYLAAASGSPILFSVGAILALGLGWAWTGLMVHAVIRAYSHSPGAATGMTSGGLNVGGVVGPFVFGLLVQHASYTAGFIMIAAFVLLAAIAAEAGRRQLIYLGATP